MTMVYVRDRLKNVVVAKEAITMPPESWSEIQISAHARPPIVSQ